MNAFAAVFAREVFERRFVFVVALASGIVPLIGSVAHGWSNVDAAEGRVLVALVGATALSAAFAILLGAAVLAGETTEKRISFYFSRPISAASLWAGKLLAAIAITLASAFLAFAPGWLSGPGHAVRLFRFEAAPGRIALAALALAVVLVLGGHALATVARLRSPWVALDLVLAPTVVLLAGVFLRSLLKNSGTNEFEVASPAKAAFLFLVAAIFLALLAASFVQVAEGRTDARRAHGAFSVVFFGILGTAVAFVGAYAGWCASAKATDLAQVWGSAQMPSQGPWIYAGGPLRGWRGGGEFLFDAATGRSLRMHGGGAVFSQDGTRAVWAEPRFGFFERNEKRADLVIADLVTGRRVATGLETEAWFLAFSPSGQRLALRDGKTLSVFDVSDARNPKQLAAFENLDDRRGFAFVDEDTLRLFPRVFTVAKRTDLVPASFEIAEISLPSKKIRVTGRFDRETVPYLRLSPDARLLVGTRHLTANPAGAQTLTLHDGRIGALVATLTDDLRSPQARFLTGNRIAVAGIAGAKAQMRIFLEGKDGEAPTPTRTIDLGPAARVVLGGEIAPGIIAISLFPFEENPKASQRDAKLALVNVASGTVSPVAEGLTPANRFSWWLSPVLPPAGAGVPASALFIDADSRLVRLDPGTGVPTVLLGEAK